MDDVGNFLKRHAFADGYGQLADKVRSPAAEQMCTDKNVVIKDYRNLSGHPAMPFYIDKGLTI